MATGAQAIERIARDTGLTPITVLATSRPLKRHEPPLWAKAGKGGGKNAKHVEPTDLVNLALALAMADTFDTGPEAVLLYRGLESMGDQTHTQHHNLGDVQATTKFSLPPNRLATALRKGEAVLLGNMLDFYVALIATNPDARERLRGEGFAVHLTAAPAAHAVIAYTRDGVLIEQTFTESNTLPGLEPNVPAASMRRTVTLPFALFETLADLWRDTLDRRESAPTLPVPPAPTTAGPEKESAAPPPRGTAPVRDHDRDLRDQMPVRGRLEARDVCANTQAQASRVSGQPPPFFEVVTHERRDFPAFAAGA